MSLSVTQPIPRIGITDVRSAITHEAFARIKKGVRELEPYLKMLNPQEKEMLFSSTMKVNSTWVGGNEDMNPLQYACFLGQKDVVALLLDHGAPVNDFGCTSKDTKRASIHFALDAGHNHKEIASLLIEKGAKDEMALCTTKYGMERYLIPPFYKESHLSALHMAIIHNHFEIVKDLVNNKCSDVLALTTGSFSCLHLAARRGNKEMLEFLLSNGAKELVNQKDGFNETPKQVAIDNNHHDLAAIL